LPDARHFRLLSRGFLRLAAFMLLAGESRGRQNGRDEGQSDQQVNYLAETAIHELIVLCQQLRLASLLHADGAAGLPTLEPSRFT